MAPRLRVYSNGPSDTLNELLPLMPEALRIRSGGGSRFRGRSEDLILNYGSSSLAQTIIGEARILNNPVNVGYASNKRIAFDMFRRADVKTVQYTTDGEEAQTWVDAGDVVYARTRLSGHSGEGIVIATNNEELHGDGVGPTLPSAPLYTKGISAQRREYRIHVMHGVITNIQQKKRVNGYADLPEYSDIIRNHHTGWIYATQQAEPNNQAKVEALKAIEALGLDYGAVDIITRRDEAWVLEVNTAPGMTGSNAERFAENVLAIFNNREVNPAQNVSEDLSNLQREVSEERAAETATTEAIARGNAAAEELINIVTQNPTPTAFQDYGHTVEAAAAENFALDAGPLSTVTQAEPIRLVENGIYIVTMRNDDVRNVGVFSNGVFELAGWEIPVTSNDINIVEALGVL